MTLRTWPTSLDAGRTSHSSLPAFSAFLMRVSASARGSLSIFLTLGVLLESQLRRCLAEALAAHEDLIAADDAALAAAANALVADAASEDLVAHHAQITSTLNFSRMRSMASSRVALWCRGTLRASRRRRATRPPRRSMTTATFIPKMPISGSYFMPGKSV